MRVLKAKYKHDYDRTTVKFTDEFCSSDWITKIDVLKDMITILTQEYESMLGTGFQSNLPAKSSADLL